MMDVVYSASRNLYPYMLPTIISLLKYNKDNVGRIFLMIEDDALPYPVPEQCQIINVSDQKFFKPTGPNFRSCFTYMALMRAAYTEVLPKDVHKVLQLDIDTIICDDLTDLWDTPLEGKWLAACNEWLGKWHPYGEKYYNIGVCLFNLDEIRKDNASLAVINFLNTMPMLLLEQDAWNFFGLPLDKIVDIPVRYNECFATGSTDNPAVVHYAGVPDWMTRTSMNRIEYLNQYRKYFQPPHPPA